MNQQQDKVEIKKKCIIFRNPHTGDIITEVEVPKYIKLTQTNVCDLESLRNRLKMLYIDVLCRGYHPVKGFESKARNVFKHEDINQKSLGKTFNVIMISNNEAVGTIWRCLAREIGRPIKNYKMNDVFKQLNNELQSLRLDSCLTEVSKVIHNKKHRDEYLKMQKQLDKLAKDIRVQMSNIEDRCEKEKFRTIQIKNHVTKVMGQQIIELERDIFLKSLIGIRQCQQNAQLVQLVMQQSYPYIKMPRKKAIEILTYPIFKQKEDGYKLLLQKYELEEQLFIICHRCLLPLNNFARMSGCNDERASLNVPYTLLTDPYMYCRQIINENCWDKDSQHYMHPYLIYYGLGENEKTPVCNRYYCNKCQGMESGIFTSGQCGFCEGNCDCSRCQGMDLLTRMMAVYIDNGGELKHLTDNFYMKFDTKVLETKNKKNLKSRAQKQSDFQQYLQSFYAQKIFTKKKLVTNFERIEYFPEKTDEETHEKSERYKMSKIKLPLSRIGEEDEQIRRQQIQNLENIARGRKKRYKIRNDSSKNLSNNQRSNGRNNSKRGNIQNEGIQDSSNEKCSIYNESDS